MSRWGSVLVVAAALAGSCSGTESSEGEAGLEAEAVTTTTPSDDGAAEVAPSSPPAAGDLMTIAEQQTVGVGTWTSPLLGEPVTFDVTQDLVLTRSASGLMMFVSGEDDAVVITLLNPTGVVVPALEEGPQIQQVAYPTDLGVWFEESPDIDLLDSGSLENQGLEAPPAWFEVATSDSAEEVVPCSVGARCLRVFTNPIAEVVAISEPDVTTHRVYQLSGGASPLVAVVSAPAGSDDTVFAPIDAIAESLCVCGPSIDLATVRPEPLELLLNQSELLAGVWQTTVGTADLAIRNSTPVNASLIVAGGAGSFPGVIVELRAEADDGSQKFVAIVIAGVWRLVDPALANNRADETLVGLDTRDIEAWAEQHPNVRVEGSGTATLGGQSATWYDLVGESLTEEGSYSCVPDSIPVEELPDDVDPLERCVTVLVIEGEPGGVTYISEDLRNAEPMRIYVLDDLDLMITVTEFQPPIDEALGVADDFFDHLDIGAAAPDPNEESDLALLEAAWTEALAAAAAVPFEPDLTTWCEAAVAAVSGPGSGDTPEQTEANAAVRETLLTELTRLSNEGARDAAEMRLAAILAWNVVLEAFDWVHGDLSPVLFVAAMPDSVDAGGRDAETAEDDLVQHFAANC